ncbi:NAD(P)-dependent oxidoreductase [Thalassobaculum sp.]|uniref:NAD-dependent epimerase/dehydratase family protein n=1 Tax=Thalassobaculum sp. TaxID=2022740 RepID=UPI0032EFABD5
MSGPKVAITGGSGRFGRFVVDEFQDAYDVTVIDKAPTDRPVRSVVADVLDLPAMSEAFQGHDAVVHLAGIDSGVKASEHDYFETNVQGTWNVLAAAEAAGVRKAVVCASIAAYGLEAVEPRRVPDYLPFDEEHPLRPDVAYDLSKQVCETVSKSFARRGRMSVVCLRPAWIIFPDRVADFDARAREADGGGPLPAGHRPPPPHRAYVRPDDAARCFRLALERGVGAYDVFNVGASDTMSRAPTLAFMEKVFGRPIPPKDPTVFVRDPRAAAFGNARARSVLGWEPTGNWDAFVRQTASTGL